MNLETRLRLSLKRQAKAASITIDDALETLARLGGKATDIGLARRVLRKPFFKVHGWTVTDKPSRHGRPVRRWIAE